MDYMCWLPVSWISQILTTWASAAWLMETQSRAATLIRWSSRWRHWSPGCQSKFTLKVFHSWWCCIFLYRDIVLFSFRLVSASVNQAESAEFLLKKLCKSNRVSEMNPQKEHCAGKLPQFITDSQLKCHLPTKTYPLRLGAFRPLSTLTNWSVPWSDLRLLDRKASPSFAWWSLCCSVIMATHTTFHRICINTTNISGS